MSIMLSVLFCRVDESDPKILFVSAPLIHLSPCKNGSDHVVLVAKNDAKLIQTDVKHLMWILKRLGYHQVALPVRLCATFHG